MSGYNIVPRINKNAFAFTRMIPSRAWIEAPTCIRTYVIQAFILAKSELEKGNRTRLRRFSIEHFTWSVVPGIPTVAVRVYASHAQLIASALDGGLSGTMNPRNNSEA